MLNSNSLEFAREHITSYYDTDFYPKPFEYRALWYFWDEVQEFLLKTKLPETFSGLPRAIAWPKARGGYRVVHQLEPLDAITYVALVHSAAARISAARMGPKVACSYRIEVDDSSFFADGSGFSIYRERCEALSAQYAYVLSTDVSDFYNQIYLHRVHSAMGYAGISTDECQDVEQFLTRLNNKASQGLPIGPAPSVVLAEAVMMDVDQKISNMGLEHVRYVDDIRIFSNSKEKLERCLEGLVIYLHEHHRLNVVGEKTSIRPSAEFLHEELQNQYQLEKLDILRDIEVTNPYSAHVIDDEDEDEDEDDDGREPGEVLLDALQRVRKFGLVDLAVIRAIIRRAKAHSLPDLAATLLGEIDFFAPAANDVVLYLAALPDYELQSLIPTLSRMCDEGALEKQCVRLWMEWLFSQKVVLMADASIRAYVFGNGSAISKSLATVVNRNFAWAKDAKGKVLNSGSWERRAYIYSLSVLPPDELKHIMFNIKKHPSLTMTDKWVAKWVELGCPEPRSPFEDYSLDNMPF